MLAEFRQALRDEMEAARRNESSSGVPLVNGRRIAQVGGSFQYVFDVENALNLPGDAPGDLHVPGRAPLQIIVISVEGLAITISVPANLGAFVPTARLQSNLAYLMRKLIERIEALRNVPNPVGERMRGALPVSGEPIALSLPAELNQEQRQAVSSSLGRNTTFIWGPPGTGKTRTIGTISEQLYKQGRSVLLVSHTNAAVDQALMKIGDALGPEELSKGKVLRVGESLPLKDQRDLLLVTHVGKRSEELTSRRDALKDERDSSALEAVRLSRVITLCEWVAEAKGDMTKMSSELWEIQGLEAKLEAQRAERDRVLKELPKWVAAARAAAYARSRVNKVRKLEARIAVVKRDWAQVDAVLRDLLGKLSEAERLHAQVCSMGWLSRRWRRLPSPEDQEAIVEDFRRKTDELSVRRNRLDHSIADLENNRDGFQSEFDAFCHKYSGSPEEVHERARNHQERAQQIDKSIGCLTPQYQDRRFKLEDLLRARLAALREWGLTAAQSGSAEVMLGSVADAFRTAAEQVKGASASNLRQERDRLNGLIRQLDSEIQTLEEALKKVEESVIADATIIATTLTRAYLRDSIQNRRFDTVILDEASMAPIPALWVAASLADNNAVVVGDFKQLPPIVLSQNSEIAKRWLGRDIFKEADLLEPDPAKPWFVPLTLQYRMHPEISAIPNALFYGGRLKDSDSTSDTSSNNKLPDWYRFEWGQDHPVLLVDTGSVGAWVTSVSRGTRSSRLNFLSATICVDLAEKMLRDDRPEMRPGDDPRILIISPYRPHAQLLELLLREEHLDSDVRAGTVHSFQGSEADVVILDLVNDEPHWRVAMFIPRFDDQMKPLLNVALTRAKRRLVIVGDFSYAVTQGKNSFLGHELIPLLQSRYTCVDALNVVPAGLSARAAKAQSAVLGGDVEPSATRLVVTQEHFFNLLRGDLGRSTKRVVIYSAFITQNRLGGLEPQLRAAVERGVAVYVVTKTCGERGKRELSQYRMLERTLTDWGVVIVHKRRMHEKLIFIDDRILWSGSLNPLSHSNTQEIMERRCSNKVVKDFSYTLRLDDLVGEYEETRPVCPICGSEIVATEGADDPFYWRCVEEDCYRRSIDQPPLMNGEIVCANCGGEVEYGEWGGNPYWRCLENRRHRQRVAKSHLRLPKMRARIPKRELRRLERALGLAHDATRSSRNKKQPTLFNLNED